MKEQLIIRYWQDGGLLLMVIAGVCFFIWLNFFYILLKLNKLGIAKINENKLHEMIDNYSNNSCSGLIDDDLLSGIFHKIKKISNIKDVEEVFKEFYEDNIAPFNADIKLISALVTAAPLIGLLGTVWGMVETFQVLSISKDFTTQMISSGISKALITTQFGLLVATPAVFAVSVIKRKLTHLEVRYTQIRFHIINHLMGKTS